VGNSGGNTTKKFGENLGKYWFYVDGIIGHDLKKIVIPKLIIFKNVK